MSLKISGTTRKYVSELKQIQEVTGYHRCPQGEYTTQLYLEPPCSACLLIFGKGQKRRNLPFLHSKEITAKFLLSFSKTLMISGPEEVKKKKLSKYPFLLERILSNLHRVWPSATGLILGSSSRGLGLGILMERAV